MYTLGVLPDTPPVCQHEDRAAWGEGKDPHKPCCHSLPWGEDLPGACQRGRLSGQNTHRGGTLQKCQDLVSPLRQLSFLSPAREGVGIGATGLAAGGLEQQVDPSQGSKNIFCAGAEAVTLSHADPTEGTSESRSVEHSF